MQLLIFMTSGGERVLHSACSMIRLTGGPGSYSEQLQAALFCPVPACISLWMDDAIQYKGEGTVENPGDPEYISNTLL